MRRLTLALVLLSASVAVAGCRRTKDKPPDPPPPGVTVVRPVEVKVSDSWTYNGYLETTKTVEVRSKIRGFLTKIEFVEGTEVKEKDPLYEIDKREFETAKAKAVAEEKKAQAELIKAEAEIKNWDAQIVEARIELDRVKRAVAGGGESENVLVKSQALYDVRVAERDAARASRDAAKANVEAAAAALHTTEILLGYTDIQAKIGGRISRTLVDVGNLVLADTTVLTTIVKVDELYVYFDAPETDVRASREGLLSGQSLPVEVGVGKEDGFPHKGFIDFRENRIDTGTGTLHMRGRIKNPPRDGVRELLPGMYARVRVPRGKEVLQPVLPEDALMSGQEGRYVYVVGADNKVQKREVLVGATVWKAPAPAPGPPPPSWVAVNPNPPEVKPGEDPPNTRRAIRSVVAVTFRTPLRPDERVILDGLHRAKPRDLVNPTEWVMQPDAPAPAAKP